MWSRRTLLCGELFTSFFHKGAWKKDRKIFLTILYGIYDEI